MRKINDGIVFSNDIERILKGYNAINFNYQNRGLIIPNDNIISVLRDKFKKDTTLFKSKYFICILEVSPLYR